MFSHYMCLCLDLFFIIYFIYFHITCAYVWISFLLYILYIFILHVYGPFCSYCCVQFIPKSSGKKKIFIFSVSFFF